MYTRASIPDDTDSVRPLRFPISACLIDPFDIGEPSPEDLDAIDREWPLIEAELDLVAAEIRVLTVEPHPSDLDWRRLRRAERRVGQEIQAFHTRLTRMVALGRAA